MKTFSFILFPSFVSFSVFFSAKIKLRMGGIYTLSLQNPLILLQQEVNMELLDKFLRFTEYQII